MVRGRSNIRHWEPSESRCSPSFAKLTETDRNSRHAADQLLAALRSVLETCYGRLHEFRSVPKLDPAKITKQALPHAGDLEDVGPRAWLGGVPR